LYNRAVVACGSAFNPWAFYSKRDHIQIIKDFGVRRNNPLYDYDDIVEYLSEVDAKYLTKHTFQEFMVLDTTRIDMGMIWSPIVEHSATKNAFLTKSPEDIMYGNYENNADVLFIYGSNEMLLFTPQSSIENLVKLNKKFEFHLPLSEANINYNSKTYKEIALKIRKHYFAKDGNINTSHATNYIRFLSDVVFGYGMHKTAEIHALKSKGKTFNWIYSGKSNVGGSHCEDTSMTFLRNGIWGSFLYENFSDEILNLIRNISTMISNFARYSNPAPMKNPVEFKHMIPGTHYFLNITRTELIPSVNPNSENYGFWDQVFEDYFGKRKLTKDEL